MRPSLCNPCYADRSTPCHYGTNAKNQIANTYATQPQVKLRNEMDAAEQAELSHGDADMSSSGASAAGARGAAGAGALQRTNEEVGKDLGKSSRVTSVPPRNGLSRPDQERKKAP